jgi:hypothetical protein
VTCCQATLKEWLLAISNNALVFNRGATGVDKDDFDKKFSLAKTLTNSSLERPPAIVLIETIRAVLNSRMRPKITTL